MDDEDADAQVARRLQRILDEEATTEALRKFTLDPGQGPLGRDYERRGNSRTGKGKSRARDNDGDDDDDDDNYGKGSYQKNRRGHMINHSHNYDSALTVGIGRDRASDIKTATTQGVPHTSTSDLLILTALQDAKQQEMQASLSLLQQFYSRITSTRCHKCKSVTCSSVDVKTLIGDWAEAAVVRSGKHQNPSLGAVKCNNQDCGAVTCLGCGRNPSTGINRCEVEGLLLDWCCNNGRLFAIWLFLARYDQIELRMQTHQIDKITTNPRKPQNKGIGYAAHTKDDERELLQAMYSEDRPRGITLTNNASSKTMFRSADEKTDRVLGEILNMLCELLPSTKYEVVPDMDRTSGKTLSAMLSLSLMVDKLAELFRNDSINDLTKRSSLYFAAFRFAEMLGSQDNTVDLVTEQRYSKGRGPGLQALSVGNVSGKAGRALQDGNLLGIDDSTQAMAPPLITCLANLYKQSQILLSQATTIEDAFAGKSGQMALDLCYQIVMTYTKITSMTGDKQPGSGKALSNLTRAKYHEEHALEQTDDVLESFHFQRGLRELRRMKSLPMGRMQHLVKEIATLATSLPEGIFVKSCASTPGALKCLIVGPEDTPYAGGLFEFDIFAGANFPNEPPKVFFSTTGGGLVTFNPNLYDDGKVCLSLLNTFEGRPEERWQPKKSTLISILVSIQSMIFCKEPWRNEPSNTNARDRHALEACANYNVQRQCLTVRYAMINWLSKRKGLWHDVVRHHFQINSDEVLKTVKGWSRTNPGIRSFREQRSEMAAVRTYRRGGSDLLVELEKLIHQTR